MAVTAFVNAYLLGLTQLRRYTVHIASLFPRLYALLHCAHSPPPALSHTHVHTVTQPSFSPQAQTHSSTLPPFSHTGEKKNAPATLTHHIPLHFTVSVPSPGLSLAVTLRYTHTFPLNTLLICLSSPLCHTCNYSVTHNTLPLFCTVPPLPPSFITLSLLPCHNHIPSPSPICIVFVSLVTNAHSYIVTQPHTRFVTHTQCPAPLPRLLSTPPPPPPPSPPRRRPAAAPMTSRRARRAARRGRRLAGRASAALQSRRGSYNCGGMGGTDHCIAHL